MNLLALLGLGVWGLNWIIIVWGTWLTFKQFRERYESLDPNRNAPVSVLKPLKGADEGLYENLQSFFKIDYPRFEILFSVSDENDPAFLMVRELIENHPEVDSKILCASHSNGINPKINNLVSVYDHAKYDIILISDSNIRVKPNYLRQLIPDLHQNIGIITAVVAGIEPKGLGGWLEASYLNTFFARWMIFTKRIGFPSVVGKSMIFRKTTLNRIGGLKNLGHYIAEDYMAGHAIDKLDLKVELMHSPIEQFIGVYSVKQFWDRHLRWGRIRKSIAPLAFLIEPFFFSTLSGLIGALSLSEIMRFKPLSIWSVHMLVWAFFDALIYKKMVPFSLKAIGAWVIREALSILLWLSILSGNTVFWRGQEYRLLQGGLLARNSG